MYWSAISTPPMFLLSPQTTDGLTTSFTTPLFTLYFLPPLLCHHTLWKSLDLCAYLSIVLLMYCFPVSNNFPLFNFLFLFKETGFSFPSLVNSSYQMNFFWRTVHSLFQCLKVKSIHKNMSTLYLTMCLLQFINES